MKGRRVKGKVGEGVCEVCGILQTLCYFCRNCGFTTCGVCLNQFQNKFLCASAIAWICPNCSNWGTL